MRPSVPPLVCLSVRMKNRERLEQFGLNFIPENFTKNCPAIQILIFFGRVQRPLYSKAWILFLTETLFRDRQQVRGNRQPDRHQTTRPRNQWGILSMTSSPTSHISPMRMPLAAYNSGVTSTIRKG